MKMLKIMAAVLLAMTFAACGDDDDDNGGGNQCDAPLVTKPAGMIAVGFTVDDTANKLFGDEDLEWKGAMAYDPETWVVTNDTTWAGPTWAPLYDDGGWDCGGHEPAGAVAGDNKLGTVVFVEPPATGSTTFEYGLIDRLYEDEFGNGWIWRGTNGSFVVNAGDTADKTATGMTVPAFGNVDLRLTLDTGALAGGPWDTSTIAIKGSAWAWGTVELNDDGLLGDEEAGDGIFTFVLSEYIGAGNEFSHTGLLKAGDRPEFIWVVGEVEYKTGENVARTEGVTAETAAGSAAFAEQTIAVLENGNTYVTVP